MWEGWKLGNLTNILVAAVTVLLQKFVALKVYAQEKKMNAIVKFCNNGPVRKPYILSSRIRRLSFADRFLYYRRLGILKIFLLLKDFI